MEGLSSYGTACYSNKDLILYAIGIGCCAHNSLVSSSSSTSNFSNISHYHNELRHVYEKHDDFQAFPTFLLILPFRATPILKSTVRSDYGMPPFPTKLMKQMDVMKYIQNEYSTAIADADGNIVKAIIHLSEELTLHRSIPTPQDQIHVQIQSQIISMIPKSIGIIVITETNYYLNKNSNDSSRSKNNEVDNDQLLLLATSQSTSLYILKQDYIQKLNLKPFVHQRHESETTHNSNNNNNNGNKNHHLSSPTSLLSRIDDKKRKLIIQSYTYHNRNDVIIIKEQIPNNQALIYRVSGDTNPIHVVVDNENFVVNKKNLQQPILHGLCSLGFAVRIILNYCHDKILLRLLQSSQLQFNYHNNEHHHGYYDKKNYDLHLHYVSCDFVNPIFIGDELEFLLWEYYVGDENVMANDNADANQTFNLKNDSYGVMSILFQIRRESDQVMVVKNGLIEVQLFKKIQRISKL